MAILSMFYGIIISMYYMDNKQHHIPHIHVSYQGQEAVLSIPNGELLEGDVKSSKMKLIQAWIEIHQDELIADWELALKGENVFKIEPLKQEGMITINPRVAEVTPNSDYTLTLMFSNGEIGEFDMKPYLEVGIFKELKNQHLFNTVKPFMGTVQWVNEQDLCPDTLYLEARKIKYK